MYKYEYSFISHQGLSENETASLINNLCTILTNGGATILKKEYWGLMDFAYDINKQKQSDYFMICVEAEQALLTEFKRKLKLNELIMRFLQIKIDKVLEGDSLMLEYINNEASDDKDAK